MEENKEAENQQNQPIQDTPPQDQTSQEVVVRIPVDQEQELFSWKAPARPFKKRDRDFWLTLVGGGLIIGFILLLAEGPIVVILGAAVFFLYYILSTVEPEIIENKITNHGVRIHGNKNLYENMTRFWFTKRFDNTVLVLETLTIPGRIELVIHENDLEEIKKSLSPYVLFEQDSPSYLDRATTWFHEKFPKNSSKSS